jgi:hypothetical protein
MKNCAYKRIVIAICLIGMAVSLSAERGGDSVNSGQASSTEEVILKIITAPPHAKIYINSAYFGISPLTARVAAYTDYIIEAHLHKQMTTARISIAGEKITEINLKFAPEPLNIAAFIILFVLTVIGVFMFGKVKIKEAKYSSVKRMYSKK